MRPARKTTLVKSSPAEVFQSGLILSNRPTVDILASCLLTLYDFFTISPQAPVLVAGVTAVYGVGVAAIVHFGQRTQSQQVRGPGVEGQSGVFNPSSLPLMKFPS